MNNYVPLKVGVHGSSARGESKSHLLVAWFVSCFLALAFYFIAGPSEIVGLIALLLYVMLPLVIWKRSKLVFIATLLFYVLHLSVVVSNAYLETGKYMMESHRVSYATGSTLKLLFYLSLYFFSTWFVLLRLEKQRIGKLTKRSPALTSSWTILCVIVFVQTILLVNLLIYGSPVFSGVDRFTYWNSHPIPYLWNVLTQLNLAMALIGSIHALSQLKDRPKQSFIASAILVVTLVLDILHGDKFSSINIALILYAMGYLITKIVFGVLVFPKAKMAIALCILVVGFFSLVQFSYINIDKIEESQAVDYMMQRAFALQGQVWWSIENDTAFGLTGTASFFDLIRESTTTRPGGLYMLMFSIAPSHIVDFYIENNIQFTMGSPAIALYTLGYFGVILYQVVAGIITAGVCWYFIEKICLTQYIRAFVAIKLLWMLVMAFCMGNVYLLLAANTMLYVGLILADIFVFRSRNVVATKLFQNQRIRLVY
jgi:hypothetical protein